MRTPVCAMAATRKAARLLTQLYDSHLQEYGVEASQFALLMTIAAVEDRSQSAVATAMGMDKTTLSRNVKLLERQGWVHIVAGRDARRRELEVSAEGRVLLQRARPAWRRAQEAVRRRLGGDAWETALSTLQVLADAAL